MNSKMNSKMNRDDIKTPVLIRVKPELLEAFDQVWHILKAKSRNHFLRVLMQKAVDEYHGKYSEMDPFTIEEMMKKECAKLVEKRLNEIFGEYGRKL